MKSWRHPRAAARFTSRPHTTPHSVSLHCVKLDDPRPRAVSVTRVEKLVKQSVTHPVHRLHRSYRSGREVHGESGIDSKHPRTTHAVKYGRAQERIGSIPRQTSARHIDSEDERN